MLEEPELVLNEGEITLPVVSLGKHLPSFTDEEIWHFVGERGCYSDSPECLKYCFRDLVHREGYMMYRMKPRKQYHFRLRRGDNESGMFSGVMIHDPMECFLTPETCLRQEEADYLFIAKTHDSLGEEFDVLECWCSVPYDDFKRYLNPETSMVDFEDAVSAYLANRY